MPQPVFKIAELERLMETLDVITVSLVQCDVSYGYCLSFPPIDMPCIYYGLAGWGRMFMGDGRQISLSPHKLVIAPPRQPVLVNTSMCHAMERARRMTERSFSYKDPPEAGQHQHHVRIGDNRIGKSKEAHSACAVERGGYSDDGVGSVEIAAN